jgi:hypothetical protein
VIGQYIKTLDEGKSVRASCATSARIFVLRITVIGVEAKSRHRVETGDGFQVLDPERNGQPEDGGHRAFVTASS